MELPLGDQRASFDTTPGAVRKLVTLPSGLTTRREVPPRRPLSKRIQRPSGDQSGARSVAERGSPAPGGAFVNRLGAPPATETTQIPPWLAYANRFPSGDHTRPVLPPGVLVRGSGQPPAAGIKAICPFRA